MTEQNKQSDTPAPETHLAGYKEAIDAAKMARTRLMTYANGVQRGEIQGGGREFERRIWGAFSDFDQACDAVADPPPETNVPAYRFLVEGDLIEATDEFIGNDGQTWARPDGWEVGMEYPSHVFKCARRLVSPPPRNRPDVESEIARVVQSVNEWDDRTSPDDYPDHLLITSEELTLILRNFDRDIST